MGWVLEGETKVLRPGFFDVQNRVGVGRDEDDYHQASNAQFTGLRRLETESGGKTIRGSTLPSVGTMLACPDPSKDVQSSGIVTCLAQVAFNFQRTGTAAPLRTVLATSTF